MTVSNVGPAATPPTPRQPEPAEVKGPEVRNDHDGDDGASAPSALPKGQGTRLDTKA